MRIHVPTADAPLKIEEEQKQQAMLDVFSARYGTPDPHGSAAGDQELERIVNASLEGKD